MEIGSHELFARLASNRDPTWKQGVGGWEEGGGGEAMTQTMHAHVSKQKNKTKQNKNMILLISAS
jgi:hypothetical protein